MNSELNDKLNDILRHEWTGVAQYSQASFVVSGFWREVYSGMFAENAKECFGHAQLIGDKIVALGGVPSIERNPVKQSNDLAEMLNHDGPYLLDVICVYQEHVLPMIPSGKTVQDIITE